MRSSRLRMMNEASKGQGERQKNHEYDAKTLNQHDKTPIEFFQIMCRNMNAD